MSFEKYDRQMRVGGFGIQGQERLAAARILVVGAGGLGAACLPYLAGAGIGHICIMDDDIVELSNLHRQVIYNEANCGTHKAVVAKDYLTALNGQISVDCILEKCGAHNAYVLAQKFDLIVDCTDNYNAKYAVSDACEKADIPMVSASIEGMSGYLGVFGGAGFGSYRALFNEPALNALNCADSGVLGSVAGMFGVMQAHEVIKYLSGVGEVSEQVIMLDMYDFSMRKIKLGSGYDSKFKPFNLVDLRAVEDAQLLDVREIDEFKNKHLAGAIHCPLSDVSKNNELGLDKLQHFVLYCAKGPRAEKAAIQMQNMGFENLSLLNRGIG